MERLFHDLKPIAVTTGGKPDPHENLTDILEIVAVSLGHRRAHLQGQGQNDPQRLDFLEAIGRKHGLTTIRTRTLIPYFHRPRNYDARIVGFEDANNLRKQREGPEVLWMCVDQGSADRIPDVVAGRTGVSTLLGYPTCCERHSSEQNLIVAEAYVQGIIDTFHPPNADEIVRLWQRDVQVQIAIDPDADILHISRSLRAFPYVQFTACAQCRAATESPASRVNDQMRDLAFQLSPAFGSRIWRTRDLVVNKGRPIPVGRNDRCPCGRGAKFKKCCGQIDVVDAPF
jgi:hypothetical protein